MSSYNQSFDSDDSVIRHVIIGLLADLNNKIYFYRQLDKNNRVAVDVPFYYSISGDDQFLRDNFLFSTPTGPNCFPDAGFADGNYDQIPRGVVSLTGMSIDAGKLVNKRNVGSYTKINHEGAMEGYVAEFEMIPITISVDVDILINSMLDSLKITEAIIKKLYKSNHYNVEVGHLNEGTYRLTSYYAVPDDYNVERPIDFAFERKDEYKISLPLEINTFIPAFEWETERHAGNRMFEIHNNIIVESNVDTRIVTEEGIDPEMVNTNYQIESSFNAGAIQLQSQVPISRNVIPLDINTVTQPVIINSGSIGQEAILIALNGDIELNTLNFAGAPTITILNGGSVSIKYFNGVWYPTSFVNTNIEY